MSKCAIFIVGTLICVATTVSAFTNCDEDDKQNYIKAVRITGCPDGTDRCLLKRETNVTIEIDFIAKLNSPIIKSVVHGVILGVPVPFPLDNPDGCKDCGITCPVVAGQEYKYSTLMQVKKSYPRVTVDVKWELQDDKGTSLICILIPSKIK